MDAPSLHQLQGLFWTAISTAPGDVTASPPLLDLVAPSATLDRRARLRVYADAYLWRLVDVLREDFPRVATLLGDGVFADAVQRYLREHPSTQPSVAQLGRRFPAFLASLPDVPRHLADLARLERARLEVFTAADADPLPLPALRAVATDDWPRLPLHAIPALRILRLRWPVQRLWSDGVADGVEPAPTILRIWRAADYRVFHAVIDGRAARALTRLIAGCSFAEMCAVFADLPDARAAADAVGLLARWVEDGIVTAPARVHEVPVRTASGRGDAAIVRVRSDDETLHVDVRGGADDP
jgi:hypothetical protein